MSGDVQLKKRREKKKRKDDGSEEVLIHHQQQTATPLHVTDDLHIHVQKDHGTEGGICAKLVFFVLLTLLVTLIGGIISEHRGLTDLDIVGTESRFAHIFDGFIDISADEHESPELYSAAHSEEEHDDEEDDVLDDEEELSEENIDEHDESPENEDNEVEESNSADEEEEEEEEEVDESNNDDDVAESEEVSTKDEEDVEDENENTSSNANNDESEEKDNDEDDDDEPPSYIYERKRPPIKRASYYMNKYKETHKKVSSDSQEDTVQDDSKERVHVHKVKTNSAEDRDDAIDSGEEDEKQQQSEEDELEQQPEDENEQQPDEDEEESQVKTEDGEETTAIKIEEVDEQEMPLISSDKLSEIESEKTEADEEEQEVDYISMMIKFGVGTALLVVAHVVLIQKWRKCSANEPPTSPEIKISQDEELLLDLSRRNTIVAPPKLEEIQQEIEEYSEEENDLESDEDDGPKTINIKKQYQELQSTYSQTLTPEWEPTKPEEEEEAEDVDEEQDYDAEISEDEDDDEDLLRRLEAKYGKIEQDEESYDEEENPEEEDEIEELEDDADADADYEMWKHIKRSAAGEAASSNLETEEVYKFSNITNKDDYQIKEQLDLAQENLINDTASALTRFNQILERNPSSPRALYGKAQCLDILAEQKRSNSLLQDAITIYQQVLKIKDVPDGLFQTTAERCINRMRFKGLYNQAVLIHNLLIDKYPHIIKFQNNLAVTYLTINKVESARRILQRVLTIKPNDGFALVHYGFILKTIDDKLKEAVTYLNDGIKTKEEGVIDGRFYFHLGDALIRLGKKDEAMNVFIDGVNNKVFLSKYQRSLYNVPRLTGKPWWKIEETPHITFFTNLEKKWTLIKNEGLNLLNTRGNFQPETENLRDVGDWKQFELYARGIKNIKNCKQCPVTCKLLETFTEAIGCRRGQIKFSVMHPGTHVWPHCGPTNCRLRAHLGLKIPQNTFIRVGDEIRSWEDGKILIFDDSFEHEVWHNGSDTRLILIVDFWHPDLTMQEKIGLPSI